MSVILKPNAALGIMFLLVRHVAMLAHSSHSPRRRHDARQRVKMSPGASAVSLPSSSGYNPE
jgi:hypothetical protein